MGQSNCVDLFSVIIMIWLVNPSHCRCFLLEMEMVMENGEDFGHTNSFMFPTNSKLLCSFY